MDNEDSPRQKAWPFLVLLLLSIATLFAAFAFIAWQMSVVRSNPQLGDILFLVGGVCLASSLFLQWRRYRIAPSMEFLRQNLVPPVEQVAQILGYTLLCAANFAPSLLVETTLIAKGPGRYGNFIIALLIGMQAIIGLFFFVQERLRSRRTARVA